MTAVTPSPAATIAGAAILNRAQAVARVDAQDERIGSNEVVDRVGEVLDVALAAEDTSAVQTGIHGETRPVPLLLRNLGNGQEAFQLSATVAGAGPQSLAVDSDGDGRFDPARDVVLRAGDASPLLAPGATVRLFVLLAVSGEVVDTLTVRAAAVTGSGPAGTLFAGRGDGGGDAITGLTTAQATVTLALTASAPVVALIKSQRIEAPDGSVVPVRGATIRYTIEARVAPGGGVPDARLVDPVPAGARYVAGSLSLDGTPLSDTADGDAGAYQDGRIEVVLGPLAAPSTRTVAFAVKIE